MITIKTAEDALKTVYLGVIGNQLNFHSNPLLSKIYCKKGNPRKEKRNRKWKKRQKPP